MLSVRFLKAIPKKLLCGPSASWKRQRSVVRTSPYFSMFFFDYIWIIIIIIIKRNTFSEKHTHTHRSWLLQLTTAVHRWWGSIQL